MVSSVHSALYGPRTRLFCIALYLSGLQKVDVRGPSDGNGISPSATTKLKTHTFSGDPVSPVSARVLFHDPAVDVAGLGAEVDPDSEDLAGVRGEREDVLLLPDLLQGLLGRAVELELHHVHVV